eukprot:4279172-Pyramimonas_sp.AAC.1
MRRSRRRRALPGPKGRRPKGRQERGRPCSARGAPRTAGGAGESAPQANGAQASAGKLLLAPPPPLARWNPRGASLGWGRPEPSQGSAQSDGPAGTRTPPTALRQRPGPRPARPVLACT